MSGDDVTTGSDAGLDMRRRREPEVLTTSRDLRRRRRLNVTRKPASSSAAHRHVEVLILYKLKYLLSDKR